MSVSWKKFQKIDGECRQDTHSQHTSVQYSLFTSAECIARAWLKSHGLQCHLCAPEKSLSSGPHMSHLLLHSHLPRTTSTCSSSFTFPSTTTPERALQSGQHVLLQEHPVHHQAYSKLSQSKSNAIENHSGVKTSSGGNPRNTFSTVRMEIDKP